MTAVATQPKAAQAPAKRKPGLRKAADVPKVRRLSPLIRAACILYVEEDDITITEIAKRLNCERTYLSRMLQQQHVVDHLARERERFLLGHGALNKAARVYRGLLDSESDKIKMDVADRLLVAGQVLPSDAKGSKAVSVNVGVQVGYVVDWNPQAPVVDVTPERG